MLSAEESDEQTRARDLVDRRRGRGRFAGHAGCNRYTGAVETGDQPGNIAVGPVAGTRMMCPEPAMGTETRFLRSLVGARKYTFVGGQLVLVSEQDGTFSAMFFDRAAPR